MKNKLELREIREKHGHTQESLADVLGVSRNYIYLVESGRKPLSNKLIRKLEELELSNPIHAPGATVNGGIIGHNGTVHPAHGIEGGTHWPELFRRLEAIELDLALIKKLLSR